MDEKFAAMDKKFTAMETKLDKFCDTITSIGMESKFNHIIKNHTYSIHNIKVLLGQLANVVAPRTQGHLSSNTEVNPKE